MSAWCPLPIEKNARAAIKRRDVSMLGFPLPSLRNDQPTVCRDRYWKVQMPDPHQVKILSVTELTSEIRFQLSNQFSNIWVSGEVSGLTRPGSGHQYFTLKDKTSQISGIIWRSTAERMKFKIENGLDLVCFGDVDVYPQRGNYQLIVRQAQPMGEGALQLAFRQLHHKLKAEGLFDAQHKRRLPAFPRRIALITSPSGAAIRDFLQVLNRRWPNMEVIILPVKVQGDGSAREICRAIHSIKRFRQPPDVVVLTRGGGSIEDLWSFNEEAVCRAIFDCQTPVVCGVGHEIDVTLADLTADVRALTPSEAAERITPNRPEVLDQLHAIRRRMQTRLVAKHHSYSQKLAVLATNPVLTKPFRRLQLTAQELDRIEAQMFRAMQHKLTQCQHATQQMTAKLEAINPLSVLARGYSFTSDENGKLVTDSKDINIHDTIITRLANGELVSKVTSKT